jgi:O-antigen ligase
MSLIPLAVVFALFMLIAKRLRLVFLLFLSCVPLFPRYVGLAVGSEGLSISLVRLALLITALLWLIFLFQNSRRDSSGYRHFTRRHRTLLFCLCLFFIARILSWAMNEPGLITGFLLLNDLLISVVVLLISTVVFRQKKSRELLINFIFFVYLCVVFGAFFELWLGRPPMTYFSNGAIYVSRSLDLVYERSGIYRVSSTLGNPVLLGQYLVCLAPVVLYKSRKISRFAYFCVLAISIAAVYLSGSRGALLMLMIMMLAYSILYLYSRRLIKRSFLFFLVLLLTIGVGLSAVSFVFEMVSMFEAGSYLVVESEQRSLVSRSMQYVLAFDLASEHLWFGYGRQQDFSGFQGQLGAIDNYYLNVLLETGIIGLSLYLYCMFLFARIAMSRRTSAGSYDGDIVAIKTSICLLVVYQLLVAIPDVNVFLYFFVGVVIADQLGKSSRLGRSSSARDLLCESIGDGRNRL